MGAGDHLDAADSLELRRRVTFPGDDEGLRDASVERIEGTERHGGCGLADRGEPDGSLRPGRLAGAAATESLAHAAPAVDAVEGRLQKSQQ
jgi:hypothetical protein